MKNINIDGKNYNSQFFLSMTEEEAIDKMIAEGITKDREWAKEALKKMVEANGRPVKIV